MISRTELKRKFKMKGMKSRPEAIAELETILGQIINTLIDNTKIALEIEKRKMAGSKHVLAAYAGFKEQNASESIKKLSEILKDTIDEEVKNLGAYNQHESKESMRRVLEEK